MRKFTIYLLGIAICGMLLSQSAYSRTVPIDDQVILNKEKLTESLKIYPNPSDGRFQLTLEQRVTEKVSAKVYDITGKLIKDISRDLIVGETSLKADIDLDSPKAGIYFLRIKIGSQMLTKKIIIK